jgi:hypothetical protein
MLSFFRGFFFKKIYFFIIDRTTDRTAKQTSASTSSSTTASAHSSHYNHLKRPHHAMQQNTNANYEAYQHLPNKSYYNVRATPHATQGRHQEDQPPPPREIPLEPQPQINFQISLAPPPWPPNSSSSRH